MSNRDESLGMKLQQHFLGSHTVDSRETRFPGTRQFHTEKTNMKVALVKFLDLS